MPPASLSNAPGSPPVSQSTPTPAGPYPVPGGSSQTGGFAQSPRLSESAAPSQTRLSQPSNSVPRPAPQPNLHPETVPQSGAQQETAATVLRAATGAVPQQHQQSTAKSAHETQINTAEVAEISGPGQRQITAARAASAGNFSQQDSQQQQERAQAERDSKAAAKEVDKEEKRETHSRTQKTQEAETQRKQTQSQQQQQRQAQQRQAAANAKKPKEAERPKTQLANEAKACQEELKDEKCVQCGYEMGANRELSCPCCGHHPRPPLKPCDD